MNVGLPQLRRPEYTLCWAGKWLGEPKIHFGSSWDSPDTFVQDIHGLIDSADVVVGYNQDHFDLKHLNKDFHLGKLGPPSPYQSVDLLKVIKKAFRFPSNKLAFVTEALSLGTKTTHSGHTLWVRVMEGDVKAQQLMKRYCKQDVKITEELLLDVLPWISNYPNRQLFDASATCPRCGTGVLTKAGFRYTHVAKFQTYRCNSCGGRSSDTTRTEGVSVRNI